MEGTRPGPQMTPAGKRSSPEPGSQPLDQPAGMPEWPSPAVVTFVTTEHFVLQGARSATIAESNGRASIFLGAVSGGLIALGFIGQASRLGTAFYAFGLILLPALAFVGLTTFYRVFQAGLEDVRYAQRTAQLRAFYFDAAPEVERYLLSVSAGERLEVQGIWASRAQKFLTMAGTVAVITAILAGSAAGLLAALLSGQSPWAAFPAGTVAGTATFAVLARYLDTQIEAARRNMLPNGGRYGCR
jgi:hypothetical protein